MTLREHREDIIRAFTLSLDSCIMQAEDRGNPQPTRFETETKVQFEGIPEFLVSHPILDLTQPIEPQLETKAKQIEP